MSIISSLYHDTKTTSKSCDKNRTSSVRVESPDATIYSTRASTRGSAGPCKLRIYRPAVASSDRDVCKTPSHIWKAAHIRVSRIPIRSLSRSLLYSYPFPASSFSLYLAGARVTVQKYIFFSLAKKKNKEDKTSKKAWQVYLYSICI